MNQKSPRLQAIRSNLTAALNADGAPSRHALARAAGIDRRTLMRILNGTVDPSIRTVELIERALGQNLFEPGRPPPAAD